MKDNISLNSSTPLISVIVPVYNSASFLKRCVDSIRNQTYENLEIILIDDGSTDGSGALCDAFQAEDPRIRVIHQANGGLSCARNRGLDLCGGEYIAFVDSDDTIESDYLYTLVTSIGDADYVSSGFVYKNSSGTSEKKVHPLGKMTFSGQTVLFQHYSG